MEVSSEKEQIVNEEHLKLLSIFYYISGGITCLFSLFPIFHVIIGIGLIFASKHVKNIKNAPPGFIGWIFVIIGSTIIILGLTLGIFKILTGKFIKKRKNRAFCLIIAGISCLAMPYGTILGILSIIVLQRNSVKKLFVSSSLPNNQKEKSL